LESVCLAIWIFLRSCDRRDIEKELWIARYEFESLVGKGQSDWRELD
jgi:hypothetical protein